MFLAALFIICQNLEANRMASIKKLWHIQTMEYYLALRSELVSYKKTWWKLKCILLSKRSHLKSLHTIQVQLYDILEKANLWR